MYNIAFYGDIEMNANSFDAYFSSLSRYLQNVLLCVRRLFADLLTCIITQDVHSLSAHSALSAMFHVFLKRFDDIFAEVRSLHGRACGRAAAHAVQEKGVVRAVVVCQVCLASIK